jgi:hypothetical protein
MKPVLSGPETLRRLFAGLTEQAFQVELGLADPQVIDYLVDLLVRFIRTDSIYRIRDIRGRRLEEVADMLLEAEQREAKPRREVYRHIGDFTLFWTGLYPEALSRLKSPDRKDYLLDYLQQGKRSYYIASTFDDEPYEDEAAVLRRLSRDFELCTVGLNRVRNEWEKLPAAAAAAPRDAERN